MYTPPPANVRLNGPVFDFVSCDLPFPHHPFVLPILNTLGSFHHDRLSLFRFNLSSRSSSPFPTPCAHAQTERSRQANYRYISGYTTIYHVSTHSAHMLSKRNSQVQYKKKVEAEGPKLHYTHDSSSPMPQGTEEIISNRNVMEPTLLRL